MPFWSALRSVGGPHKSYLFFSFIMAIYHCNHTHIGRSTHKPGNAAAHINYITRESATTEIMADHMPENRHKAKSWVMEQEIAERKNGRIIDKVNVALPQELSYEQQKQLIIDYCREMTGGRAPWLAVMHTQPQDSHNPHAHLVFRDRDINTGKRVMMTTERGSTENFREKWEHVCNSHLAMHGHDIRIDRRTLIEQGIERLPQIHVGPEANAAVNNNANLRSTIREDKKKIGQDKATPKRKIDYPSIDKGMTRRAFNDHIIDLNLERLRRSKDYGTRLKADFEAEQRQKDRALITRRDDIRRIARAVGGEIWTDYNKIRETITKTNRQEKQRMIGDLKSDYKPRWKDHFERKEKAFREFEKKQKEPSERLTQLKRSLPHLWSQLEPTQDKARGKLSAVFDKVVKKEERLKSLTEHYKSEHQKLYMTYADDKRVIYKLLRTEYEHDIKQVKTEWRSGKNQVKAGTDKLWQDYGKQVRERNWEKKFERENLENFIEDYRKTTDGGTAPDFDERMERLKERIKKANDRQKDRDFDR